MWRPYAFACHPFFFSGSCSHSGYHNFVQVKNMILTRYTEVFSNQLGMQIMKVTLMNIFLKENAVSQRVSGPCPLPQGFWGSRSNRNWSKVSKGDSKRVRLVTDYTKLNIFVVRPLHPFPSVTEIVQANPASSKCFAKYYATHGYFQSDPGGSGCICTSHRIHTGSFASPGGIKRVNKIVMCIGTKLCYCLQKLQIS